jgi:hypothetical protein
MKITKLNRYCLPAVALAATALLTACDPGTGSDGSSPAKAPAATSTVAPSPTSSSLDDLVDDIQASNSAAQKKLQDEIDKASKSAEAQADSVSSDVPDVVGMTNAEAIPALHDAGFMANEEDASGQGRWAIDNSNWKVCRQDPGPGNHPGTLRVAIYSVKLDESC